MKSNCHLFSVHNSITKLQSSDISYKTNWLEMFFLARVDYKESDSAIIRQSIARRNHFSLHLYTRPPLLLSTIESLKKINKLLLHVILVHL